MSLASNRAGLLFATLGAIGFSFKAIFVKKFVKYTENPGPVSVGS